MTHVMGASRWEHHRVIGTIQDAAPIFAAVLSEASLLHDAIDQAVGHGLLRAEEVVAVEVQGHLLARLAAQLRVVVDLGAGRRGRRGVRVSRALSG